MKTREKAWRKKKKSRMLAKSRLVGVGLYLLIKYHGGGYGVSKEWNSQV